MSFGFTEEHKPEKLIKGMTKAEYHREYQKAWLRKKKDFDIKPSQINKFKAYYSEYVGIKQLEGDAVVSFKDFMLQFCELGFLNWRSRMKGK